MRTRSSGDQILDLIRDSAEADRAFGWPGMPIAHFPLHLTELVELMIETQELVLHFATVDDTTLRFVTHPVYGHGIQTWSTDRLTSAFETNTVGQREILTECHRRALVDEQTARDIVSCHDADQLPELAKSRIAVIRWATALRLRELRTAGEVEDIKETMTPLRLLALKRVAAGEVRWGGIKPRDGGMIFDYSADMLALGIARATMNRSVLWLLRSGYARTTTQDYDPPKGSLVSATAQGLTELKARGV